MRIKVEVAKLIEHLQKKHAEEEKRYEKAQAKYEKDIAEHPARLADALSKLAGRVRTGTLSEVEFERIVNSGCHGGWRKKFGIPELPSAPTKPTKSKLIERLKMSKETTLSLDEAEFRTFGL